MGGPPNNGRNEVVTQTPSDQLGGDSSKAVTQLQNLVSVGQISPPESDFIRPPMAPHTLPAKGMPGHRG